jgi:hypothetical protein
MAKDIKIGAKYQFVKRILNGKFWKLRIIKDSEFLLRLIFL